MKLPARCARSCDAFFSRVFKNEILFAAIIISFPAFLLQSNIPALAAETVFFLVFSLLRRGKIRVLNNVLLIVCIVFFALLTPFGKVLARIGAFPVTQGALTAGLRRALVLAGMVFMSQAAVSDRLSLPGKAGAFLARMFSSLNLISAEKITGKKISFNALIDAIDEHLVTSYGKITDMSRQQPGEEKQAKDAQKNGTPAGWVICAAIPLVLYALLAV